MREGWELKILKEIGEISSGNSINAKVKAEKYSHNLEGLNYIATKDVGYDREINYENGIRIPFSELESFRIAKKDSVIICAEGGSAGRKIGLLSEDVCFVNKLFALSTNDTTIGKYVFYWYQSEKFQSEFKGNLTGLIGGVSKRKFQSLTIPIPTLSEQKQIVAILDKAFEAINQAKANIEKNIENAKELFQSKLNEIFRQKGEGWQEKSLPNLVTESCSLSYGIVQPGDEYPDGLPIVRPTDMKKTFIETQKLKKINPRLADSYTRTNLTGNELLLCVRGDTGVVSLTNHELNGANVTRGIVPIVFNNSIVRLKFGYFQFISELLQKQIKEKTYGAALMQINIRDVKKLTLNIPPLSLQDEILPNLISLEKDIDRIKRTYDKKLKDLEELKKSILQKAFVGKLTNKEVEV
jgi:type I restriction enzyme, S subunit